MGERQTTPSFKRSVIVRTVCVETVLMGVVGSIRFRRRKTEDTTLATLPFSKERQNKPPAPCSVLFWPVLEHPQNKRVLFCSATRLHRGGPGEPGGRRGRGWARKRGPLGARPPSPGPRGSAEACGGGDQAKIRGLSDKICSAGGRSLAICAPSAQSARRRH